MPAHECAFYMWHSEKVIGHTSMILLGSFVIIVDIFWDSAIRNADESSA